MPKEPDKKSQVSISLQLNIDSIYRLKIVQETRIEFESSVSIKSRNGEEEESKMTSSVIPFQFDFSVNKLKTLTTKRKTTDANGEVETVEVKLPLIGAACSKFQILYCVGNFRKAARTLGWTTGPKLFNKWKELLEDDHDVTLWDQHYTSNAFTETVANFWLLIRIFISLKFANNLNAYDNHKEFLLRKTKDCKMRVREYISLL